LPNRSLTLFRIKSMNYKKGLPTLDKEICQKLLEKTKKRHIILTCEDSSVQDKILESGICMGMAG
jgi:hypothetical protein